MAVLVTGGAGYIGSVFVEQLREAGEKVIVLDNLVYGHRSAVDPSIPFFQGDIGDKELVSKIAKEHKVEACVHFAAYAYVGESVTEPAKYFENNTTKAQALLDALIANGLKYFVFSSTCATYGVPNKIPISEDHPQWPINPYGWSKFFVERILESYDTAHDLRFVALRYFNAAGAIPKRGEHHDPETHLIPLVMDAATGKRSHISVFGSDYDTPDGTAIRDYIHVADLGLAHSAALKYLRKGGQSEFFNLGNGKGYSVLEVIETTKKVSGQDIPTKMEGRRAGDPPRLIADATKARKILGWKPQFPKLETIIQSAWNWQQANPDGYPN